MRVCDVLLISKDPALCGAVQRAQPLGSTLRIVGDGALATGTRGTHVWIDLESATDESLPAGPRTYLHHDAAPLHAPPGSRFVRKSTDPVAVELLWSAIAPQRASLRSESGLPRWALDFQDLRLRRLCRRVSTRLPGQLGYRDISIYLHDAEMAALNLAESTIQRPIDLVLPMRDDREILMVAVAARGKILETTDVARTRTELGLREPAEARPYRDNACLIAPLISDGQLLGVICLSAKCQKPKHCRALSKQLIFKFIARCLLHAMQHERVQAEARVDALTGLFNVRYLLEAMHRELRRTVRFSQPVTVIAIDLDGLKGVNDRHGHAAGDFVLRHVSRAIVSALRQCDIAARVGGDEFLALLPATTLEGGRRVAMRLMKSLREESPAYRGIPLSVRASIGVTQWNGEWNVQQFMEAADRALYDAKSAGRDQVVLRPPNETPPSPSRFSAEPAMANLIAQLVRRGASDVRPSDEA
ncbi:MAG: sensor domain-containing diguanylate cyclase [Phycisphaerales bacterium]|nr:sensor domain-containing diguanylate cyclase [Phycisphaerales bacterium]